jgi:hypothetical protein
VKPPLRVLVCVGVLTGLAAGPLAAQGRPLSAFGQQDLNFGTLIPGVPVTISRFDPASAGQFEIRGARAAEVQVNLTLPAYLAGGPGALLPLEFASVDGGIATDRTVGGTQSFDPRLPVTVILPGNGKAYVYLGGTVRPATDQAIGPYAATITLTVSYTGN